VRPRWLSPLEGTQNSDLRKPAGDRPASMTSVPRVVACQPLGRDGLPVLKAAQVRFTDEQIDRADLKDVRWRVLIPT
jgi:hypothetical protein